MFPDANQMAMFRRDMAEIFNDLCTITVDAVTKDSIGGQVRGSQVVATNVPCQKAKIAKSDIDSAGLVADQETMRDTYKLLLPNGTALAVDQHITIASEGIAYNVVAITNNLAVDIFETAIITRQR